MKITSGDKDKLASAEIYYKPSKYFQEFAKEYGFDEKVENDTSEHEYMSKIIAIFIDMLEIVNMDYGPSVVYFGNALEGLISGTARALCINYDVDYDSSTSIHEMLEALKQKLNGEREFLDESKDHIPEEETKSIKKERIKINNIIYLKKPF